MREGGGVGCVCVGEREVFECEGRNNGRCCISQPHPPPHPTLWQYGLISLGKDFLNSHVRLKLMNYIPIRPLITNNVKLKQEKTDSLLWLELQKWGQNTHFKGSFPPSKSFSSSSHQGQAFFWSLQTFFFWPRYCELSLPGSSGSPYVRPVKWLLQVWCCQVIPGLPVRADMASTHSLLPSHMLLHPCHTKICTHTNASFLWCCWSVF